MTAMIDPAIPGAPCRGETVVDEGETLLGTAGTRLPGDVAQDCGTFKTGSGKTGSGKTGSGHREPGFRRLLYIHVSLSVGTRISRLPAWLAGPMMPSCSMRSISEAALL